MRIDCLRSKRYPLKLLSHSVKIRRKLVRDLAPGMQVAVRDPVLAVSMPDVDRTFLCPQGSEKVTSPNIYPFCYLDTSFMV
jgi:hypothetical protein